MDGVPFGAELAKGLNKLVAQSPAMGALPTLYAATAPEAYGGDYIGPDGFGGWRGHPVRQRSNALSYDAALARRLWEVSEQLTGVRYALEPVEVAG
jgi:hypothetical protein